MRASGRSAGSATGWSSSVASGSGSSWRDSAFSALRYAIAKIQVDTLLVPLKRSAWFQTTNSVSLSTSSTRCAGRSMRCRKRLSRGW